MKIEISNRKRAIIIGVLFLVAYSMLASEATSIKWVVSLLDIVSGFAAISIAVLFYPFFKDSNKQLSLGYLCLKTLGGILGIAAGIFFLSASLEAWRNWIYEYPQTYVFITEAVLFYTLLFKTKLVPRFISIWGLVACCTLLIANVVTALGVSSPLLAVLMIPIFLNEIFLAFWLMFRGFNESAIALGSAKKKA